MEDDDDLDLEDGDVTCPPPSKLATPDSRDRKLAHVNAEKRRREAIKDSYKSLCDAITVLSETEKSKVTRSELLDLAIERLESLQASIERKKREKEEMEKRLNALALIADTYNTMPKTAEKGNIPPDLNCVVSNHIKLKLFTTLLCKQFESFKAVINTDSLSALTSSLFYWVEIHWRPVDLKEYLISLLKVLRNRFVNKSIPNPEPAEGAAVTHRSR